MKTRVDSESTLVFDPSSIQSYKDFCTTRSKLSNEAVEKAIAKLKTSSQYQDAIQNAIQNESPKRS